MDKQISLIDTELSKDLFIPVKNRLGLNKPEGGLWSCPYTPNNKYISDWHEFCMEQFRDGLKEKAAIFDFKSNTRIYTVNSLRDLNELYISYEHNVGEYALFNTLNYEELSKYFDIIYLTPKGQSETRFTTPGLYGWDIESCLIMNFDCIMIDKYLEDKFCINFA
jgi:hypothetical protein